MSGKEDHQTMFISFCEHKFLVLQSIFENEKVYQEVMQARPAV